MRKTKEASWTLLAIGLVLSLVGMWTGWTGAISGLGSGPRRRPHQRFDGAVDAVTTRRVGIRQEASRPAQDWFCAAKGTPSAGVSRSPQPFRESLDRFTSRPEESRALSTEELRRCHGPSIG